MDQEQHLNLNKPERLEWLQDAGFGMFIHFSFDSQLGIVISHSMVGASDDYLHRFMHDLPQTFDPAHFDAAKIARLAKLAGMKYIVFTAKHHSGFCMWDTKTTDFDIMNTAFGRDLLKDYVRAVRQEGLAVGLYYSPEDFYFLHEKAQVIRRRFTEPIPQDVMRQYLDYVGAQCAELMTEYGKIDVLFFDGGEGPLQEKCKEVSWALQPDVLITRGAIETPEQTIPGIASEEPFEACITMGTQWQYKPTNDMMKSGSRLIEILIETRAKGGALLLNIGPAPDGSLPVEQESRLREVAAWYFINREAVDGVRPWILTNEDNIWFTQASVGDAVYAIITGTGDWSRGERRTFLLRSVRPGEGTTVEVLGQSGDVVEYQPDTDGKTYWEERDGALMVSCVRAQRIYNNHRWHNPIVLKITGVDPALDPPVVQTVGAAFAQDAMHMEGRLVKRGDAESVLAGFEYREYAGFAESLHSDVWRSTELMRIRDADAFESTITDIEKGREYEYRALVVADGVAMRGASKRILNE
jgi:alpha-L-fucosidase